MDDGTHLRFFVTHLEHDCFIMLRYDLVKEKIGKREKMEKG